MSQERQDKPVRKAPRWMKVTMVLSLALNLLIFGAIGARFAFGPPLGSPRGLGAPGVMFMEGRRMMRNLSPERRQALRSTIGMHKMEMRRHRDKIARARARLAQELAQDKLDIASFKAEMVKMKLAETQGYEAVMRMRENFLRALNKQERQMFARGLLRHQEHRGPPWRTRF